MPCLPLSTGLFARLLAATGSLRNAAVYGQIRHSREADGKSITVEDAMLAATARAYGMEAIVTRNTRDFLGCGVTVIDPWQTP